MTLRRALYIALLFGFALILSGCGGAQNPLQFDNDVHPFLDGMWDGLTILIAFIWDLVSRKNYGINSGSSNLWYEFGYLVGVGVFFYFLYGARLFIKRR